MWAAVCGHTATVVALVNVCRAKVNAVDENGETALMLAVQGGHEDTVSCLATELQSDTIASNFAGASCLHAMAVSSWAAAVAVTASEDQVYHDIGCDGCEMCPIGGPRWKCKDCPNYYLCHTCHARFLDTGDHYTAGHVFENAASAAAAAAVAAVAAKLSTMTAVLLEHGGLDLLLRTDSAFGWIPIHYALYAGNESLARSLVERLCRGNSIEVSERLGYAKQNILRHMGAPLSLFRGLPSAVKVWQDDDVVAFRSFCSVRSNFCCPPGTCGYYELVIIEMDMFPQYGFTSAAFNRVPAVSGNGVGDDTESWAVDGARKCKLHDGTAAYECKWKVGDVVGLAWMWRRCRCSSPSTAALRHPMAVSLNSLQTQCSTAFLLPLLASVARCAATWTRHPSSTRRSRPT